MSVQTTDIEDYRVQVYATAHGWFAVVVTDDGLELVESVDVE